mmetsp:Transcript_7366/g.18026  ORF Transcript_7366/g.18026 Transcript_7366/m.18026 type:complete len:482 (+) Transcript_7366:427-1872(+)
MFLVKFDTLSSSFGSVEGNSFVFFKRMEGTNSVGSSTYARNQSIGEPSIVLRHELFLDFFSNHALEVSDDGREGVGTDSRTNQIVCVANISDPVRHGFVDGILECALTILNRDNLGTEGVHTENIKLLTFAIDSTHINSTVQSKHSTYGCGCNTVLSGTGFGNDTGLANSLGQKSLSNSIVDLVGTSVGQIFSLQPNVGSSCQLGQTFCLVKRGRSTDEFATEAIQFCQKLGIVLDFVVFFFNFLECNRESFGNVLSSEFTESGLVVGVSPFLGDLSQFSSLILGILRLLHSARKMGNHVANCVSLLFRSSIVSQFLHGVQNGTSNHNSVGHVCYAVHHLGGRDSESYSQRKVGRLSNSLNEVVQIRREFGSGTGYTGNRHTVQKCRGHVGQGGNSLVATGRGNERDIGKTILDASLVQFNSLLRRQINNNETVGTCLRCFFAQSIFAILNERVDVSHEYNRNSQSHFSRLFDHVKTSIDL